MTAIYFAGAEIERLTNSLVQNGATHILYSYYYIRLFNKEKFIERIQRENPHISFFLDSGAFTFFTKTLRQEDVMMDPRGYTRIYFKYIENYGDRYAHITEPDFDRTLESIEDEEVKGWREGMLSRWSKDLSIVPVWHGWRGEAEYKEYLSDPRIRCIALGRGTRWEYPGYHRKLVQMAHRAGKKVHGFGMTKMRASIRDAKYDSVDSITWLMGQKYGTAYIFDKGKFTILSKFRGGAARRKLYRKYYENIGCDPEKVFAEDVEEFRKANIIAWTNLSKRLQVLNKFRGEEQDLSLKEAFSYTEEAPKKKDTGPTLVERLERGIKTQLKERG